MPAEPEVVNVPSAGQPAWKGEITDRVIEMVIGGLLTPNQALSKALAMEVRELRAEKALR